MVHREECATAQRLRHKDSERFITVVWSEEPVRAFETGIVVTVRNGKGVLARVAQAITSAEGDISLVSMADQVSGQEATELRFVVSVEHAQHLQSVLASLRRVPAGVSAQRTLSGAG